MGTGDTGLQGPLAMHPVKRISNKAPMPPARAIAMPMGSSVRCSGAVAIPTVAERAQGLYFLRLPASESPSGRKSSQRREIPARSRNGLLQISQDPRNDIDGPINTEIEAVVDTFGDGDRFKIMTEPRRRLMPRRRGRCHRGAYVTEQLDGCCVGALARAERLVTQGKKYRIRRTLSDTSQKRQPGKLQVVRPTEK